MRRTGAALRCAVLPLLAVLALSDASCVSPASAAGAGEYGEVTRFGGFDQSAYNGGRYGGPLTPGELLDPMGFTVDAEEGDDVYVVDRTSAPKHNPSSWRIQKFSPSHCALGAALAGCVLGATTFTLANAGEEAAAITGLAVDHGAGRLYALVDGSLSRSTLYAQGHLSRPVARELLAWSTKPGPEGELLAAPGLRPDPLGTTGGVVSSREQIQPRPVNPKPSEAEEVEAEETWLYEPQGIAIDRLESPGVDNPVVIEASNLRATVGTQEADVPGETIVQQIATQGADLGDRLASWSAGAVAAAVKGHWGPEGIFDNPDGSMSVLLEKFDSTTSNAFVVRLSPSLEDPQVLNGEALDPPIEDADQGALWVDLPPFYGNGGNQISEMPGAGSEVAQLSTAASNSADGLYAGDFFSSLPIDYQSGGRASYWRELEAVSNIGVRLLQPGAGGAISGLQGEAIANTLGNATAGGACSIRAPWATLAAGAAGTLWVLDRGPESNAPGFIAGEVGVGRQIIELAPGAGRRCPQPSGTFSMEPSGGSPQSGEDPLTVPAGTTVVFHANTVELQHGTPFAYEWDLDGDPTNGPNHDGFETINQIVSGSGSKYLLPTPKAEYTYTHPGVYRVRLKLRGDYGVYEPPPATVTVKGSIPPQAQFRVTSSPGAAQTIVDAAGSTPGVGTIVNYHWSWGDGTREDEGPQSPLATHTYAQPGVYKVTLTITNSAYQSATSLPQAVTVAAPPAPPSESLGVISGPLYAIPPLYSIPPPAPNRAPTRLSPRASFAHGKIKVKLSCPAVKVACAGSVRVQSARAFAIGSSRSGGAHRRAAPRKLALGQASFTLGGGHSGSVSIRVSAKGMALLQELGRLPVLVSVAAHDSLGDPGSQTVRLTLSAPAPRGRRAVHKRRG